MQLAEMGFPLEACRKAVYYTGNMGPEMAFNWIIAHMEEPGERTVLDGTHSHTQTHTDRERERDCGFTGSRNTAQPPNFVSAIQEKLQDNFYSAHSFAHSTLTLCRTFKF